MHGPKNKKKKSWNVPRIFPCDNESAMRRRWQKNTAGR